MARESEITKVITTVSGPAVLWRDGIYRDRYQAGISRLDDTYRAIVHCLCGRAQRSEFRTYDDAHAYMMAGIERARQCDPFDTAA